MRALAELETRLQNTSALIVQYENALAVPENAEYKTSLEISLHSLQKLQKRLENEFIELAAIEEQEVYKYRILDTVEPPTLGGIAEAWAEFQKLFGTVYRKLTNQEMPATLGYSYCFAGSVGVVVTLPKLPNEAKLLTGNPIDDTSEIVFDLIESKRVTEIARSLGPEPIAAMNEWLGVHIRHGYGLGLEWQSERVTKRSAEIASGDLPQLQTTIAETTSETTLVLSGELFAVDTDEKTFKIRPDDGTEDIGGTFTDAITEQHAASVPHRYQATIIKTTRIVKSKKEKPITYALKKLEPLSGVFIAP